MSAISELEKVYEENNRRSKEIYQESLKHYPSGVSHDARYAKPFPIYAAKAKGTRKWDVDGNEYVDYVMGHGALLFGYHDDRVYNEFQKQIEKGLHIGACTEMEVEWAKLIKGLVPSARNGLVRATSCGGEAIQMAVRLARIYSGKDKIVIHAGAYHGKQASTIYARRTPPIGIYNARGIPEGIRKDVIIVPLNNLEAVEEALKTGEVACMIQQGNTLIEPEYLRRLRELTEKYGVVFIMDEVVSGFRYSAGGAQEFYNVIPDLTVLGKVIGGGAPVGAVCGRREIMELYSFKDDYWNRFVRLAVGGTWNAQPVCIAGGIAMMRIIQEEKEDIYPRLYDHGRRLIRGFNELAEDIGVTAYANGLPFTSPTTITINLFKEQIPSDIEHLWQTGPRTFKDYENKSRYAAGGKTNYATYLSMINNRVFSYSGRGGNLCTKYTSEDLEITIEAFSKTLTILSEKHLVSEL